MSLPDRCDVVIAGAGLAGLAAARRLRRAGASVAVLEARERAGGRALSQSIAGDAFDLGGQWIGAAHARARALCAELGVSLFPTFHAGDKLVEVEGRAGRHRGEIPALHPLALVELEVAIRRLERLAARGEGEADARSAGEWMRGNLRSEAARAMFTAAVRVILGAEPDGVSLGYFLRYARASGGVAPLIAIEGGAQQDRVVGGVGGLAGRMAEGLEVAFGAPVRAVRQERGGVVVETDAGEVRAGHAILAIPPPLLARVRFDPLLPADIDQLCQRSPMGATVKCLAVYERPFWRDAGLSGEVVADGRPLTVVFDNTSARGVPALLGFVVGAPAMSWASRGAEGRREAVLSAFARWFGPEARRPLAYAEKDWGAEEWTRGCPVAASGPFVEVGALRRPWGRVRFAGTEAAREFTGFLEGALRSGEEAAAGVLGE